MDYENRKEKKKPTVLIADGSAPIRWRLRDILEENGYEVVGEAADGGEVLNILREEKPDVVAMDTSTSSSDGVSYLKEIKKYDRNIKVVMISSLSQKEQIMDGIKAGALDFILKPFVPHKVASVLKRVVNL